MNKSSNFSKASKNNRYPFFALLFIFSFAIGVIAFSFFTKASDKNVFSSLLDMTRQGYINACGAIKAKGIFLFLCERFLFDEKFFILIFFAAYTPFSELLSGIILLIKGSFFGYAVSLMIRIMRETDDKKIISFCIAFICFYAFIFILLLSLSNKAKIFSQNMRLSKSKAVEKSLKSQFFYDFLALSGILFAIICIEAVIYNLM